ncbi:hypothetical protein QRQ56_30900 [Bradyrhizobium sp. U531]|uniref:hypothetical protein n=1 Tax=Bradyrhizobium sp. U531 TaxID=3053458 RepID=UPI003F422CFB
MPRSYYRNLLKSGDLNLIKDELVAGCHVVVTPAGGRRLAGKTGRVVAMGATGSQARVLFDGAKHYTTLHVRFLELVRTK